MSENAIGVIDEFIEFQKSLVEGFKQNGIKHDESKLFLLQRLRMTIIYREKQNG